MVAHNPDRCTLCGGCAGVCPTGCITVYNTFLEITLDECTDCGECVRLCPVGAFT